MKPPVLAPTSSALRPRTSIAEPGQRRFELLGAPTDRIVAHLQHGCIGHQRRGPIDHHDPSTPHCTAPDQL